MSLNPYVDIKRVIDTTDGVKRSVDFINTQIYNNVSVSGPFLASPIQETIYGDFYKDVTLSNLRKNTVPLVINNRSDNYLLDKNNFTFAAIVEVGGEYKLRLYSKHKLNSGNTLVIKSIIAFETKQDLTLPSVGLTNSGSSSLSDIEFDADTMVHYLNALGRLTDKIDGIQDFLDGLSKAITTGILTADLVQAGTVTADKIQTDSKNLLSHFTDFEKWRGREIPRFESNLTATIDYDELDEDSNVSLKLESTAANGYVFLHPIYHLDDAQNAWLKLGIGEYVCSVNISTTSASNISGRIKLVDDDLNETTIYSFNNFNSTQGVVRLFSLFNLTNIKQYSLKFEVDQSGVVVFFDDIQIEEGYTPTAFNPKGRVVIQGGNIQSESINTTHISSDFGNIEKRLTIGPTGSTIVVTGENQGQIFSGVGNHGGRDTGFYMDADSRFSLSNQLIFNPGNENDLAELKVTGTIRGILENETEIPSNKLEVAIQSIVVSSNLATVVTTTPHVFLVNEKIDINGITTPNTSINGFYQVTQVLNTTSFTFNTAGISNGTYTGTAAVATLKELTMGLHRAEGAGTSYEHDAGSGIRLDRYNWWFTNNQFRVGSSGSYLNWNGDQLKIQGSGSKKLVLGVSALPEDNYFGISNTDVNPTYNNINTQFYAGADGRFSLGNKLTFDGSNLAVNGSGTFTGLVQATSGYIGGTSSGWVINTNTLQSRGSTPIVLDGSNSKIYIGTGTYGNQNTPIYMDGDGKFSLKDKFYFDGDNLFFEGSIKATSGEFIGNVTVGTGTSKININATASTTTTAIFSGSTVYGNGGFWMDASGRFSLGNSTKGLTWDGTDFNVKGDITGSTGTFSGAVSVDNLYGNSIALTGLSGTNAITSTNFKVTNTGYVVSSAGTIGGWTIGANSISKGAIKLDSTNERIYLNTAAYLYGFGETSSIGVSGNLATTGYIRATNFLAGSVNISTSYQAGNITNRNGPTNSPLMINGSEIITQNTISSSTNKGGLKTYENNGTLYINTT